MIVFKDNIHVEFEQMEKNKRRDSKKLRSPVAVAPTITIEAIEEERPKLQRSQTKFKYSNLSSRSSRDLSSRSGSRSSLKMQ